MIGGAANVLEDIDAALKLFEPDFVVACNDGGVVWSGKLDHWVSLHPDQLTERIEMRRARKYPMKFETWSHEKRPNINHVRAYWEGSSGLFAAKVAVELGSKRTVLCGIPITHSPHVAGGLTHRRLGGKDWSRFESFQGAWVINRDILRQCRVRSMSGYTKELLKSPDADWLRL